MQSNVDASGKKGRKIRGFHRPAGARGKMFPVESEPLGKVVTARNTEVALKRMRLAN
jgi:hypothetical protein